jgi:hypothetical protein
MARLCHSRHVIFALFAKAKGAIRQARNRKVRARKIVVDRGVALINKVCCVPPNNAWAGHAVLLFAASIACWPVIDAGAHVHPSEMVKASTNTCCHVFGSLRV